MDDSEHDVLAYMTFPFQHRTKLHSTNPLERLNKKVKRRADIVGTFPNEASITRLIGAVLLEQNDEWLIQHRYMQIEGMTELTPPLIEPNKAYRSAAPGWGMSLLNKCRAEKQSAFRQSGEAKRRITLRSSALPFRPGGRAT